MTLHPQILEKDGQKQFVVLPYEEFEQLQELLDDFEDLKTLRAAKTASADEPTMSLDQVKDVLGI
jgi:PHD/YefM family antitoxin component YafN of YafNO toxin-antitoxin module